MTIKLNDEYQQAFIEAHNKAIEMADKLLMDVAQQLQSEGKAEGLMVTTNEGYTHCEAVLSEEEYDCTDLIEFLDHDTINALERAADVASMAEDFPWEKIYK